MGLFGFGKKENVVDLAEKYRQQKEEDRIAEEGADTLGRDSDFSEGDSVEERRRKLAKRILEMTKRLEDLSTKMYNLQQRIEVLERRTSPRTE